MCVLVWCVCHIRVLIAGTVKTRSGLDPTTPASLAHRFPLSLSRRAHSHGLSPSLSPPPFSVRRFPPRTLFRVEKADATIKTFYTNLTPRFGEPRYSRYVLWARRGDKSWSWLRQTNYKQKRKKTRKNKNEPGRAAIDVDTVVQRRELLL